mmetsp:Transcript_111496/g.300773  ORF Transcript_111496/g.300773 Transcript_111496/m.300773 type:complete len:173 (-) Transcript_111496:180-698(-)
MSMKYLGAYLMAVIGGNEAPSADDVKAILEAGGIECEKEMLDRVISNMEGNQVHELIAAGSLKFAACGGGGGGGVVDRPGSHGMGSAVQRSPSAGGLVGGTPRGRTPSTNARAPSPGGWRAPIRAESPGPGAYQRPGEAGAGTPRVRPPGLPSGHRISESPLRQGGRHIAGF